MPLSAKYTTLSEHREPPDRCVCPTCLQASWHRTRTVLEQVRESGTARRIAASARAAARARRWESTPRGDRWGSRWGRRPSDPSESPTVWRHALRTIVYVWGYSRPRSAVLRQWLQESAEARRFAAGRGWDGGQPEAWAGELASHLGLLATLAMLEPLVRSDAAVVGWGGRTLPPGECPSGAAAFWPPWRRRDGHLPPQETVFETAELLAWQARLLLAQLERLHAELRERRQAARALRLLRDLPPPAVPILCGLPAWSGPDGGSSGLATGEFSPPLPPAVFERLNHTVAAASERAARGCLADGYSLLLDGLRDAEEALAAAADGSEELVRISQLALDNYVRRYGVSLE